MTDSHDPGPEGAGGDAGTSLLQVGVAAGGAVVEDELPGQGGGGEGAVLRVGGVAGKPIGSPTAQVRLADGVSITGVGTVLAIPTVMVTGRSPLTPP